MCPEGTRAVVASHGGGAPAAYVHPSYVVVALCV